MANNKPWFGHIKTMVQESIHLHSSKVAALRLVRDSERLVWRRYDRKLLESHEKRLELLQRALAVLDEYAGLRSYYLPQQSEDEE